MRGTTQNHQRGSGARQDCIEVVSAADDGYALPLAVTIRSLLDTLEPDQPLRVWILNGGISAENQQRLVASWRRPRTQIEWLTPPLDPIADLKTENHLNLTTYLRLFMPTLLPADVERVLFLDADLLIRRSIRSLWDTPLGAAPVAAVHDYFTPYFNTREAVGRPTHCDRYPDKSLPVPNYRALGLQGTLAYFNAGVMLVNLAQWRQRDVFGQAVALLRTHREHVRFCDQYALNVLFAGQWQPLDPRWNQNSNLWAWRGAQDCAFAPELWRQMRNDPWIVHFTWTRKPWHYRAAHPYRRAFFRVVDRTAWRGWRPTPPSPRTIVERIQDAYQDYRAWYRWHIAPWTRALKQTLGLKKRSAA
jgi:lipopolysaccharide biosynthesis glycosyltransferase